MRPDDATRLRHMLDAATEAVGFTAGRCRADLDRDRMLALALVRELEILGEAASRLSPSLVSRRPELPWVEMVAMRNRLVHGYFDVDLDVLWTTVEGDLPPLIAALRAVIEVEQGP